MKTAMDNKRKYVRLETFFPVQFTIVRLPEGLLGIDWQSGATRNVSEEGLCLETKDLSEPVIKHIIKESIQLELKILMDPPIRAVSDIVWHQQEGDVFVIGLKFRTIKKEDIRRLVGHAHWFKRLWILAWILAVGILSFAIFARIFTIMM